MICTFFGHRDTSEKIKVELKAKILKLIENGVKCFYVGNNGKFDLLVQTILFELQKSHNIDFKIVLSYINEKSISNNQEYTIFPEELESVPYRFAISKRNEWMIKHSDFVIAYCTNTFSNCHKWLEKAHKNGLTVIKVPSEENAHDTIV